MKAVPLFLFLNLTFSLCQARDVPVSNADELHKALANAVAGDTILIAPGYYEHRTNQCYGLTNS